mmetsp:Transcript_9356/g.28149  ORF Transcript_9356/g.28149 Transcript_9356/m.28149 type:complete len:208 (+) Transcript_9356:1179-1802(+)
MVRSTPTTAGRVVAGTGGLACACRCCFSRSISDRSLAPKPLEAGLLDAMAEGGELPAVGLTAAGLVAAGLGGAGVAAGGLGEGTLTRGLAAALACVSSSSPFESSGLASSAASAWAVNTAASARPRPNEKSCPSLQSQKSSATRPLLRSSTTPGMPSFKSLFRSPQNTTEGLGVDEPPGCESWRRKVCAAAMSAAVCMVRMWGAWGW